MFDPAETAACQRLIDLALVEDLGSAGDVTSQAVIPATLAGHAAFVARAAGVVAGLSAAGLVCAAIEADLCFDEKLADGTSVRPGDVLAELSGPMRSILAAERTALNFLQHLSGIATLTRRYVEAVAGLNVKLLDTRKTLPGWRLLAKYAVRCGGGHNHRMGLYDGVLIKDNHLASLKHSAVGGQRSAIEEAVRLSRLRVSGNIPLEIEVDSLDQFDIALACKPDIILLDNMPPEMLCEAVCRRTAHSPQVLLEASGGVNLQTIRAIAETGVDRISVGALTHSAPALDIALDYR